MSSIAKQEAIYRAVVFLNSGRDYTAFSNDQLEQRADLLERIAVASRELEDGAYRLLTVDELAERWRISRKFIYDQISQGKLVPVKLGSGKKAPVRFTIEQIKAYEVRKSYEKKGFEAHAGSARSSGYRFD